MKAKILDKGKALKSGICSTICFELIVLNRQLCCHLISVPPIKRGEDVLKYAQNISGKIHASWTVELISRVFFPLAYISFVHPQGGKGMQESCYVEAALNGSQKGCLK